MPKTIIAKAFTFLALMLTTLAATAQPPTDPGQGDCDLPGQGGPDAPCPLDTWVYVLVAAALVWGAYRLYKKQQDSILQA